jgi:5'-deoxynucleotidase YfbR-like HD superfamily hydrolase
MNRQKLLASFKATQQMDAIKRYSRDRLLKEESVLCHTGWICTWLIIAGQDYERFTGERIDWGKMLQRAAVHDMDEIGTGDIPRLTKYASEALRASIGLLEEASIFTLEEHLGTSLMTFWASSKDESDEGKLLHLADLASVVYKARDEIENLGNRGFLPVAKECATFLNEKVTPLYKDREKSKHDEWIFNTYCQLLNTLSDCIRGDKA